MYSKVYTLARQLLHFAQLKRQEYISQKKVHPLKSMWKTGRDGLSFQQGQTQDEYTFKAECVD